MLGELEKGFDSLRGMAKRVASKQIYNREHKGSADRFPVLQLAARDEEGYQG
jgi:hypothetical protein